MPEVESLVTNRPPLRGQGLQGLFSLVIFPINKAKSSPVTFVEYRHLTFLKLEPIPKGEGVDYIRVIVWK